MRIGRAFLFFVLLIVRLGALSGPLFAQFTTASLGGVVADPAGALIPDAKVTVVSLETKQTQVMLSGKDGTFLFPSLRVGAYRLMVEKEGFSHYVQEGITLAVNQAATQPVTLRVGSVTEQVTVNANASMVTTETATVGQLVGEKEIVDLPLNGRQAEQLLFLAPGTVQISTAPVYPNTPPNETTAVVNGSVPGGSVNYQLDGIGHNDTYVGKNLPFPNPDAIKEFNLQSNNMSAEYGNGQNVVNIVTKSGTNDFHGDVFEFWRNGSLNATNYFAAVPDTLNRNQFGGAVGGPIKKDRLFFFGSYQGTRITSAPAGAIAFVPTAAERRGDFSALAVPLKDPVTGTRFQGNQVPQSRLSAPALYLLGHVPLPNGPNGQLTYLGRPQTQSQDDYLGKVDYIRGRNQFTARYTNSNFAQIPDIAAAEQNLLRMSADGNTVRVQTVALSDIFAASPTLLFGTWVGWDRQAGQSLSGAPFDFVAAGVHIAAPPIPAINNLSIPGFFTLNSLHTGTFNSGSKTFREVITMERGRQELRLGGELVRVNDLQNNPILQNGNFAFNGNLSGSNIADFLLGQVTSFQQGAGQYFQMNGTVGSLFAQDNWKVNSKLTLQFGLRWDPFTPYTEAKNRVVCFRPNEQSLVYPNAPVGMVFGGDAQCPANTETNRRLANFAPRFGFAYGAGQKMSVRGGAGIYYDVSPTQLSNGFGASAPFAPRFTLTDVNFTDPYGSAGAPNPFPAQFAGGALPPSNVAFTLPASITRTFPVDWRLPTVGTWNLTLERQLGSGLLLTAAFVGAGGHHLTAVETYGSGVQLDPAVYVPGASTVANTQKRRVYPNFSSIVEDPPDHNSLYDALQLSAKKRFSGGLQLWANYTWSHMLDDFSPSTYQTNPFNRNFDWGNSNTNLPNILHISGVWDLPTFRKNGFVERLTNGWEITGILSRQSGRPYTLYSGVDRSFSGINEDRALFTGTSLSQAKLNTSRPHAQMISQYFNTALFAVNPIGTFGNTGKNILSGPRSFDTDMGLIKSTKITERTRLQLRAEFFNVFNTVNFGNPGSTVTSPSTFGKITGAGDPRILQLALKISF